jgi:hypothetical protein
MSSTLTRQKVTAANRSALEVFWNSVDGLSRTAPKIRGLSQDALLDGVADKAGRPVSRASIARNIERLVRQIEDIRDKLSVESVEREYLTAQHKVASANMQRLIKTGQLVPASAFSEGLHFTRQALSKALGAKRVFFVEVAGSRFFPRFYLDSSFERKQVELISKSLGDLSGATKLQFFTTGKASLAGKTPLQALADGKFSDVRTAAVGFAQR